MGKWYVLHVKTGHELDVKKAIEKRTHCEVLVPQRTLMERQKGIWKKVTKTVFPGYVFVNTKMEAQTYYKLIGNSAVINILGKDQEEYKGIEPVPFDEMKMVLRLSDCELSDVYYEKDNIKVVSGVLQGLEGQIVKVDKRRFRVKVNISFMGDPKLVDLGINLITKS